MSYLEDKLLDGPRIHYCDAGNDDIRHDDDTDKESDDGCKNISHNDATSLFRPPQDSDSLANLSNVRTTKVSSNTGPKGVIEDHRNQMQSKSEKAGELHDLEAEFEELMNDDSILNEFALRRMSRKPDDHPTFGKVYRLQAGHDLLNAIDSENPNVLIIVHIYTKYSKLCTKVDRCLDKLAADLSYIKIVTLDASVVGLSENFKENGVPALLAYKSGTLIKSLVKLEELLDRDFESEQIKELLDDNGFLR